MSVVVRDAHVDLVAGNSLAALTRIVDVLFDGRPDDVKYRAEELCLTLENEPDIGRAYGKAIRQLLTDFRVGPALVESGVTSSSSFLTELGSRISRRILPGLEDPGDLRTAIRHVFSRKDDHLSIERVPDVVWIRLMFALGISDDTVISIEQEVAVAIRTLAHDIASLGLQSEINARVTSDNNLDSPFLRLTDHVQQYIQSDAGSHDAAAQVSLRGALHTIAECRAEVEHVRETMTERGTSLELTSSTYRLLQLLSRLEVLLKFTDRTSGCFASCSVRLFREIISAEKTRNHVIPHLRTRADLLAYQVVEHAARKGGKYITTNRREYGRFFVASLGGGAIVAVFSFLKVLLGKLGLPLGIEAILYGLNYSVCFVLIYLTGSALATKQPAMTANTIAQALGNRQNRHLEQLELLVIRVWRSQFVSFAGNLFMALPIAFALSEIFFRSKGVTVASQEKAEAMLTALHPWQSGTILFAAIAGLFLFTAGLVSGWVDNRNMHAHIPQRVAKHRTLVTLLGERRSQAVGEFLDRNLGVLAGNVFLGFALGSTGTIGEIFGLPLDIRHIAFASAEFGTAIEIMHFRVAVSLVLPVAIGVTLIGLINFLVSFGLSLVTALESRQITWREIRVLSAHLLQSFSRRPLDWFFPPKAKEGKSATS